MPSKRPHSVPSLRKDKGLATELFEHLGGMSEMIVALADGDVENQLLHFDFPLLGSLASSQLLCLSCVKRLCVRDGGGVDLVEVVVVWIRLWRWWRSGFGGGGVGLEVADLVEVAV
ncbi:hypothetical protein QYF36_012750 [Acer negundo]|nr:hypothetical protein QYF36_012750 [Acer negundo]